VTAIFVPVTEKRRRSARTPRRYREFVNLLKFRQVLDCARSGAALR